MEVPEDYAEVLEEHRKDDRKRGRWDEMQLMISCGLVLAGVYVSWVYGHNQGLIAGAGICFYNGVKLYKEWEALCRT